MKNLKKHLKSVSKKSAKVVGILGELKHYFPNDALKSIYDVSSYNRAVSAVDWGADKSPTDKSSRRQKPKVFNTLFLDENKLKQRRTKLRLNELNKGETLIQKR